MSEEITVVARILSQESAHPYATVFEFLQAAFRQYTPTTQECTCLTVEDVKLARAFLQAAASMNISPHSLIPPEGLRGWTGPGEVL